ncbi:hypothetical protein CAPTEDRAFT_225171 [Capitella teleta]|uniref:Methyltransferase FkbM domain-containing protein n=1 Tax=Capitella teleta TaxID=283909 RepID=R7VD76_CAPTE|nr:hypothetical protein CAPTEDRAFT_225171 [Capitella teleta]|eukprot:ELU16778.1 hypothetical protein CAPTEDRAFT_225171 [Capitella teleta]
MLRSNRQVALVVVGVLFGVLFLQSLFEGEVNVTGSKDGVVRISRDWSHFIRSSDVLAFQSGQPRTAMTNYKLLRFIRNHVVAPSAEPLRLFESQELDRSQVGQSTRVNEILNGRTNGFYVECGAATGEGRSNSLYFERARNWHGLLIEADPFAYQSLLARHRHAYSINACLSPNNQTKLMKFDIAGEGGGLNLAERAGPRETISKGVSSTTFAQCFPIYSILLALEVKHIDYFSLDIEGLEVEILKTFPWGAITVDVWTVEYRTFIDAEFSKTASIQRYEDIKAVFEATGLYEEAGVLPPLSESGAISKSLDVVYKRKQMIGSH